MSGRDDPFQDIERLFDQFTQFGAAGGSDTPVDVVDEGDAFVAVVDLPGFSADDIDVTLDDERTLVVGAERDTDEEFADGTYVRRERSHERRSRTVTLPGPVDPEATTASYEDGVLTVRLGKEAAEGEGTDIPVN